MPLYTYRCKTCEHQFDVRQSYADDPLKTCPDCGEEELRKVINQVGVVFKGSGFYVNDAKAKNPAAPSTNGKTNDGENEAGKSDSGSGDSAASDSDSGSESGSSSDSAKTETKAETKSTSSSE